MRAHKHEALLSSCLAFLSSGHRTAGITVISGQISCEQDESVKLGADLHE